MQHSWWTFTFGWSAVLVQTALLTVLVLRRHVQLWRALFLYVLLELGSTFTGMFLYGNRRLYAIYYVMYWSTLGLESLVRLWMIYDIVRSFRGTMFPKRVAAFIITMASAMAAGAAIYSFAGQPGISPQLSAILLYSRAVDFAWIAFSCALLIPARLFNLTWDAYGSRVALGMVFQMAGAGIASEIPPQSHHLRTLSYSIHCTTSIAVLIYWTYSFARNLPQTALTFRVPISSTPPLSAYEANRES